MVVLLVVMVVAVGEVIGDGAREVVSVFVMVNCASRPPQTTNKSAHNDHNTLSTCTLCIETTPDDYKIHPQPVKTGGGGGGVGRCD